MLEETPETPATNDSTVEQEKPAKEAPLVIDTLARDLLKDYLANSKDRTQKWLAMTLKVSQSTISLWVRGHSRPSLTQGIAISYLTGIQLEAWLTDDERRVIGGISVEAHRIMEERNRERAARKVEAAIDPRQEPLPFDGDAPKPSYEGWGATEPAAEPAKEEVAS